MAKDKDIKVIDGKICLTSQALYELLDVEESTIGRWRKKGCPQISRGLWSLQDVMKWRGLIGGGGVKTEDDSQEIVLQQQKTSSDIRLKTAQLEAAEFKNALARGDYIKKSDALSDLKTFLTVFKRSCQGISNKVATVVAPHIGQTEARKVERSVSEIINDALEQISFNGEYVKQEDTKNKKDGEN